MQFEYLKPQNEPEQMLGGFYCINAFGPIQIGDDAKFEAFLKTHRPHAHMRVYIDSTGGDLETGIAIGRLIRTYGFWTGIGKYLLDFEGSNAIVHARKRVAGQCLSAATLMFLGGTLRHYGQGNKFGVHQFSFTNPAPEHLGQSQKLSAMLATFVNDMGISPEFLELSSSTDATDISFVDEERLKALDVITGGKRDVEWTVQARSHMICVRGERNSIFGRHKVMLGFGKEVGFSFWAVIDAQNRFEQLQEFGLVEIVLNDVDVRIDISQDCIRSPVGNDVHVFSQITDEQARSISISESFGVQIRFSTDAPMVLGVAAMSTKGGTEQLASLYYNFSQANFGPNNGPDV